MKTTGKITEFQMGKGHTVRPSEGEEWTRKYLEVTVKMPEQFTDGDLQVALEQVEYLIDMWLVKEAPQPKPSRKKETHPTSEYIEHVRGLFPEALGTLLTYTEKDGYVIIKPTGFLGAENFAKISAIIRGVGGEYISAGKDSHFRIAKPVVPGPTTVPGVPNFNPEDLMEHKGWKAKKKEDGSYAEGSKSWGWDFPENFSKETIEVLKRGPLVIDQYEFSLNEAQTLVSVKKKKEPAK